MLEDKLRTTRDLIYYRLANIAFKNNSKFVHKFNESNEEQNKTIERIFYELKNGKSQWPDPGNGDTTFLESDKKCIHCNGTQNVSSAHVISKSLKILSNCGFCKMVQGAHNLVWICENCSAEKGLKGLYEFYKTKYPANQNFYDLIPPLLEQKYLQTLFCCHNCAGTLDKVDINEDGKEIGRASCRERV